MIKIRRLSRQEASKLAARLARQLLERSDSKGWDRQLGDAVPDVINTQRIGKTPRYWTALVRYSKNGTVLDGPAVIDIDLELGVASWEIRE